MRKGFGQELFHHMGRAFRYLQSIASAGRKLFTPLSGVYSHGIRRANTGGIHVRVSSVHSIQTGHLLALRRSAVVRCIFSGIRRWIKRDRMTSLESYLISLALSGLIFFPWPLKGENPIKDDPWSSILLGSGALIQSGSRLYFDSQDGVRKHRKLGITATVLSFLLIAWFAYSLIS